MISNGGLPGKTLALGNYTAPGPVLPAAVGALSVTAGGEGAQVRWNEASDTATYQVLVETSADARSCSTSTRAPNAWWRSPT